ncbi:SDR family oxidoreductase [Pedobacter caeni]|uniref:Nucleoside-diphosphate-sugar epimerase n=1 Tax=Pedobacter caeni TaxID=288992 RepID=A0A1M4WUY7_9SPHI|nr:SDR family oxidoreductase [Pedobacter caeni]SHE85044.1 Nucleoside-diphosphate-sugar epimerase [Pedobacter caeni]
MPTTPPTPITTISILGCGWYGLELAKNLIAAGYTIKGSSTTTEKLQTLSDAGIQPYLIDFQQDQQHYDPDFFETNLLLISIPPKRSSQEQHTFCQKIAGIAAIAEQHYVKQVIFISSTAVYGDHNMEINSSSPASPDTPSGKAMLEAEKLLSTQRSFTTTIFRFSGLIGPGRNPGRFFAGKQNIPNGQAPVNLVHLKDCVGFSMAVLKNQSFGHIYNVCSPDHPSRQEFYVKAAQVSGLPLPGFIDELQQWKRISSENPSADLNYQYQISNFSTWMDADKL